MERCLWVLLAVSVLVRGVGAWSFVAIGDNMWFHEPFQKVLEEVRDMTCNPSPAFGETEFIVSPGDIAPVETNYTERFLRVFTDPGTRPSYLPARGNHDEDGYTCNGNCPPSDNQQYIVRTLLPAQSGVNLRDNTWANYYVDHANVRLIVVDQYSDLGRGSGSITASGRTWVESLIASAPSAIEHVFVAFHEPAYPRFRHVGDSFDQYPSERDAFWAMLASHRTKVRAVFVAHTHHYYRDLIDGVYQVDVGNAGNDWYQVGECHIVRVEVSGGSVSFRCLAADLPALTNWRVIDNWEIQQSTGICGVRTGFCASAQERVPLTAVDLRGRAATPNASLRGLYFVQHGSQRESRAAPHLHIR